MEDLATSCCELFDDPPDASGVYVSFSYEVVEVEIRCSRKFVFDAALEVVKSVFENWIARAMVAVSNYVLLPNIMKGSARNGQAFGGKSLNWDALSVVG